MTNFTVDPSQRLISLQPSDINSASKADKRARWMAMNLISELDAANVSASGECSHRRALLTLARSLRQEYFIDASSGLLTYFPRPGATSDDAFVSVSRSVIVMNHTQFVTLRGLRVEHTRGPAVTAQDVQNITLANCTVANTGTSGVELNGTSSTIQDCEVFGTGGAGLVVSGGMHRSLQRGDLLVEGNRIHHYARIHRTCKQSYPLAFAPLILGCCPRRPPGDPLARRGKHLSSEPHSPCSPQRHPRKSDFRSRWHCPQPR